VKFACSARPKPAPATRPRLGKRVRFRLLAAQNIRDLNQAGAGAGTGKKVIGVLPQLNTISREYPQLGGNYESSTTPSCWPGSSTRAG